MMDHQEKPTPSGDIPDIEPTETEDAEFDRDFDRLDDAAHLNAIQIRQQLGGTAVESAEASPTPEVSKPSSPPKKQRKAKPPTSARGKMFADIGRASSEHKPFPYGHKEDLGDK